MYFTEQGNCIIQGLAAESTLMGRLPRPPFPPMDLPPSDQRWTLLWPRPTGQTISSCMVGMKSVFLDADYAAIERRIAARAIGTKWAPARRRPKRVAKKLAQRSGVRTFADFNALMEWL